MSVARSSSAVRGASDEPTFSGAETVLSQNGTIGNWWLPQPPGFPPLECDYPTDTSHYRQFKLVGPYVYPVVGIGSQGVQVTMSIKRRLPDGSLQLVDYRVVTGTATTNAPFYGGVPGGGNVFAEDLGSTLVETVKIEWFAAPSVVMSHVELLYTQYQTTLFPSPVQTLSIKNACYPERPATAALGTAEGTVGASIPFTITRFPHDPGIGIYFDGVKIGTVATDLKGNAAGKFVTPAAPMGKHTVKFYRYGRSATASFTIKPRIKLIPSSGLDRGSTVNVSLRGYAAHETVAIRWKKGSSFIKIASVTTSSTGSANINVKVPAWAPDGPTSVRGDGSYGHAQTNAVSVSGGVPLTSSAVLTPTTTATPTAISATATPQPISTAVPTETPATPEATSTETGPEQPGSEGTPTATPTVVPTDEVPQPTETPAAEPTSIPNETPEPTTTEGEG